jgi:methionyl-tRNA formyltransferase
MKIVFIGTPRAAAVSLERLIADGHEIGAVYTQPDRPAGRGKKVSVSAVKELGLTYDLPIHQPTKIKTPEALDTFRSHNADAAIVVAYGRILPLGFLTAFDHGALNVHFSLLPKYRGAAPVNWAIVNGESETGVTIIQMDEGLDTGDILLSSKTTIHAKENAAELMERLAHLGAETLSKALSNIDGLTRTKQNDSEASFAPLM